MKKFSRLDKSISHENPKLIKINKKMFRQIVELKLPKLRVISNWPPNPILKNLLTSFTPKPKYVFNIKFDRKTRASQKS